MNSALISALLLQHCLLKMGNFFYLLSEHGELLAPSMWSPWVQITYHDQAALTLENSGTKLCIWLLKYLLFSEIFPLLTWKVESLNKLMFPLVEKCPEFCIQLPAFKLCLKRYNLLESFGPTLIQTSTSIWLVSFWFLFLLFSSLMY